MTNKEIEYYLRELRLELMHSEDEKEIKSIKVKIQKLENSRPSKND